MPKWFVYGMVVATKYIGEFEAATAEEAEALAAKSEECSVSLCHQCANQAEDAQINEFLVEPSC